MPGKPHEFLGARVDPLTIEQVVALVEEVIAACGSLEHASLNAVKVVMLRDDDELRRALWAHDVVTADGQAIVWAARLLGRPVPERVAGIDLMAALLERAEARGFSVYLLGADGDALTAAVAEIRRRHPRIRIVGARDGYFISDEEEEVVRQIAATSPDLLFVALPTPRKELFVARHRTALGARFAMGVGGAFDVMAGRLKRAPRWMQRLGLEWLFRLAQEPRRLAWRYAIGTTRFIALVLAELARERMTPWRGKLGR